MAARCAALAALVVALAAMPGEGAKCSNQQKSCVEDAWESGQALLTDGNRCVVGPSVFGDVVGCVSNGCTGVDLGELQSECAELSSAASAQCALDCSSVQLFQASGEAEPWQANVYREGAGAPGASGFGTDGSGLETTGGAGFQVQWASEGGGGGGAAAAGGKASSPAVLGGDDGYGVAVVAGPDGVVRAYELNGAELWQFSSRVAGAVFRSQPVTTGAYMNGGVGGMGGNSTNSSVPIVEEGDGYVAGEVIVGDSAGYLYRLDAATGVLLESWNLGGPILASAAVSNEYVYALTKSPVGFGPLLHKLALDANATASPPEGAKPWRKAVCADDPFSLDWAAQGLVLTADGGVVVACQWTGVVECVDGATGAVRWSHDMFESASEGSGSADYARRLVLGAPLATADSVIVTGSDAIVLLDAATGTVGWAIEGILSEANRTVAGPLAVDEVAGLGYWVDQAGVLDVVGLADGAAIAQLSLNATARFGPVVDGDGQVVLADAAAHDLVFWGYSVNDTLHENMLETERVPMGSAVTSKPVLSGGKLYATTVDAPAVQVAAVPSPVRSTGDPPGRNDTDPGPEDVEDPEEGAGDDGWPHSAIITVSTLAGCDVLLAGFLATRKLRSRTSANGSEPSMPNDSDPLMEQGGLDAKPDMDVAGDHVAVA